MPAGQWVAFEGYDVVHDCDSKPQSLAPTPHNTFTHTNRSTAGYEDLDFLDIEISGQPPIGSQTDEEQQKRERTFSTRRRASQRNAWRRSHVSEHQEVRVDGLASARHAVASGVQPQLDLKAPLHRQKRAILVFVVVGLLVLIGLALYLRRNRADSISSSNTNLKSSSGVTDPNIIAPNDAKPLAPSVEDKAIKASVLYNEGVALWKKGQQAEAIDRYQQAVLLKPDYVEAHHELGYALYKIGRYRDSVEASKKALSLKSDSSDTYSNLGLAHSALQQWQEAVEAFESAIEY